MSCGCGCGGCSSGCCGGCSPCCCPAKALCGCCPPCGCLTSEMCCQPKVQPIILRAVVPPSYAWMCPRTVSCCGCMCM